YLGADPEFEDNNSVQTVSWTSSSAPYPDGDPATDDEKYDLLSRSYRPRTSQAKGPGDYRFTISAGSYALGPGGQAHFEAVLGVGDRLAGLRGNLSRAAMIYHGLYFDLDHDDTTGVNGREHCLIVLNPPGLVIWRDPCQDTVKNVINWKEEYCHYVD